MDLTLQNFDQYKEKIDHAPSYDIKKLRDDSIKDPKWLAFGSGNIFRGFIARVGQDMIESGKFDRGISVVETFDTEIIDKIYKPYDNLALSVTLHKDGNFDTNLIGNLAEALTLADMDRIKEIALNKNLELMSFTITEKGYNLYAPNGEFMDVVKADFENDPEDAKHLMSIVTNLLYQRYKDSKTPLTLLSLDNASHNGDLVKKSVTTVAEKWHEAGKVDDGFMEYLKNDVSFPLSMIDKITPRPADVVSEYVESLGITNMDTVVTSKHSYVAPFVNSEEAEYLVIEDNFKNGRPPFEEGGVYIADHDTVNNVETMKVTTCLNPLHTAMSVYGCILGYDSISDEMKDKDIVELIKKIGYDEGLPVVINPGIIDPKEFIDEVIEVRLPNPYMPDTPQRIASDTSQKMSVRFGQTIESYMEDSDKDSATLTYIPLAIAGWLRYLVGVDDEGNEIELSSDPLMDDLQEVFGPISLGEVCNLSEIEDLLKNEKIFGVNLEEAGLSEKILRYFKELVAEPGAVRKTLDKYLAEEAK